MAPTGYGPIQSLWTSNRGYPKANKPFRSTFKSDVVIMFLFTGIKPPFDRTKGEIPIVVGRENKEQH
jgi:hypothetical protein